MSNAIRQDSLATTPSRRNEDEIEVRQCPRCGRSKARVIGRADAMPVVYLRCDACHLTSVAGI